MHATILTKDQEQKWDEFAAAHPYSSIHQTSSWAHFQSNVPSRDKFWILAVESDKMSDETANQAAKSRDKTPNIEQANQILAGTILIKHKLPRSKFCWLYAHRGPLLTYKDEAIAQEQFVALLSKIKEIAKQEKAVFLRVDPLIEIENTEQQGMCESKFPNRQTDSPHKSNSNIFKSLKLKPSSLGFQPEDTLIIDLTKTSDEILKQMKEKGRYNIRLAQKKQLNIVEADPSNQKLFAKQIEQYFQILQETTSRDKFYGHGVGFYRSMIEKLSPIKHELKSVKRDPARLFSKDHSLIRENLKKGFAKLYLAEYKPTKDENHAPTANRSATSDTPQILAGIIVTFHKDTAIYYYGASSNAHRNLMAPYLLQWHAMMEAKRLGCTKYDFLGIAPPATTRRTILKPTSLFRTPTIDELGPASHPWRGVTEFKRKFGGTHIRYLPAQELSFKPFTHLAYRTLKKLRKIFK